MKTIEELYDIAMYHNLVKNKSEFAKFIGSDKSTLSHAFKRTAGVSVPNIVTKAEHALLKAGINVENESGVQVVNSTTGDILGENAQKNLAEKTDTRLLITEMAAQREMYAQHINRLLGIIEKMQS